MQKFKNEREEADWWASPAGREYVKQKCAEAQAKGAKLSGSPLVDKLNQRRSIQISLRLPRPISTRRAGSLTVKASGIKPY
jgi:hypothetical protein